MSGTHIVLIALTVIVVVFTVWNITATIRNQQATRRLNDYTAAERAFTRRLIKAVAHAMTVKNAYLRDEATKEQVDEAIRFMDTVRSQEPEAPRELWEH